MKFSTHGAARLWPALPYRMAMLPVLVPFLASAAVNFFDPTGSAVPESLSATGIYSNILDKTLDPAAKYFEVNAALWSDNAHKDRWIILPGNATIPYVDTTDALAFPEGTIFVKLFRHDTAMGDTASRIYWETRLLVKKTTEEGNWHGFSYRWNKAATQAYLVDRIAGLDTTLVLGSAPGYRKWHFPSQDNCRECHRGSDIGRGVLGFFPAQLKRASKGGASNQVTDLFLAGVFTGTPPGPAALAKRWRGVSEPIPDGLSPSERYKVIDTMARSYIAANCSGCHGTRGILDRAPEHCREMNFDFYNLSPMMELSYRVTEDWGLSGPDTLGPLETPVGRFQFLQTLREWNVSTGSGSNFEMTRPPNESFPGGVAPAPYLVVPGYPAYSVVLYRQAARKSPAADSGIAYRYLNEFGDPQAIKTWLFKSKWGSKPWRDTLAAHGKSITSLMTEVNGYYKDKGQMPPLATYISDTAALKILSEWVTHYTPVPVSVHGARLGPQAGIPRIQNRLLIVPEGWTGKVVMTSLGGRAYNLSSVGSRRYALPASLPAGVYFFRAGDRGFRASILR